MTLWNLTLQVLASCPLYAQSKGGEGNGDGHQSGVSTCSDKDWKKLNLKTDLEQVQDCAMHSSLTRMLSSLTNALEKHEVFLLDTKITHFL